MLCVCAGERAGGSAGVADAQTLNPKRGVFRFGCLLKPSYFGRCADVGVAWAWAVGVGVLAVALAVEVVAHGVRTVAPSALPASR